MNIFLKTKHWQVFAVTFGIIIFSLILIVTYQFSILENFEDPEVFIKFFETMRLAFFGWVLAAIALAAWYWSVGILYLKILPENLKLNARFWKFSIIFPLIFSLVMLYVIYELLGNVESIINGIEGRDKEILQTWFLRYFGYLILLVPLGLFSLFCQFYNYYFLARVINSATKQKKVDFSEYAGDLILLWLWPIGIWLLQPKVNEAYEVNIVVKKRLAE
ncbi:MAG: hypothetical protein IIA45_10250 [Bacteroidetes bacterium]|nr:hypothetical protein [Bacteroidota bacterium]